MYQALFWALEDSAMNKVTKSPALIGVTFYQVAGYSDSEHSPLCPSAVSDNGHPVHSKPTTTAGHH